MKFSQPLSATVCLVVAGYFAADKEWLWSVIFLALGIALEIDGRNKKSRS